MAEYKHRQLVLRMNFNTFTRLKNVFPARRKESAGNYFQRLAKHLEEMNKIF